MPSKPAATKPTTKPATKPATVAEYLAALPPDRRSAINAVREVFRTNLSKGYAEGMQYNMIGYFVPHDVFPDGYHCDPRQPLPFAAVASQKSHMALYLMGLYMNPAADKAFRQAWSRTGKKLDMGKSCIRFKALDDLALDVLGQAIAAMPAKAYIEHYQATLAKGKPKAKAAAKAQTKAATKPKPKSTSIPAAKPTSKKASKSPAKPSRKRK
jgi:hypothetical protein